MRFWVRDILKYDIEMFKKAENVGNRGQRLKDNTTGLEEGSSKKKSEKTAEANQKRRRIERNKEGVEDSLPPGNQKSLGSAVKKRSDIGLLVENISKEFRSAIRLLAGEHSNPCS